MAKGFDDITTASFREENSPTEFTQLRGIVGIILATAEEVYLHAVRTDARPHKV